MIIRKEDMPGETRDNMRGGNGKIDILHLVSREKMDNCRLMAEITVPINGSIGEHRHDNEAEYYIIKEGRGTVIDNNQKKEIRAGDIVITGDGESHSILNTGAAPLRFIAVIITK